MSTWRPLLTGSAEIRALEAVEAIAAALQDPQWLAREEASLSAGSAGIALLYAYLGRRAAALEFLGHALEALENQCLSPFLYRGITGIAWACVQVEGVRVDTTAVDEALAIYLDASPWNGLHELIAGLAGLGVYALERLPDPHAERSLRRILSHLEEHAARGAGSTSTWREPGRRSYDLGTAHGAAGLIAFLGAAEAAGIEPETARQLRRGASSWLLGQQTEYGFPVAVEAAIDPVPPRLAWCYGDLGIAAALYSAARACDDEQLGRDALAIARRAAARAPESSGVLDASVCHGAAGVAHLFNRLFQGSGDAQLREAAHSWFERTLQMRLPGRGIAGYAACEDGWVARPGVLTGAAGVALALAAATAAAEPSWDRMLLVSAPAARRTTP